MIARRECSTKGTLGLVEEQRGLAVGMARVAAPRVRERGRLGRLRLRL